jgi:hypothetical protein
MNMRRMPLEVIGMEDLSHYLETCLAIPVVTESSFQHRPYLATSTKNSPR